MASMDNGAVCKVGGKADRLRHRVICVLGGGLAVAGAATALMGHAQAGSIVAAVGALVLLTIPHAQSK